jgi:hypothetical protein
MQGFLTQQTGRVRKTVVTFVLAVATCSCLVPATASAQDPAQPSLLAEVAKSVVLDPTTYAPATLTYYATLQDWNTSQPFFQHGYLERNARFTVSGRPNDTAIGYDAGRRQILKDAFGILQVSLVNNATSHVIDHVLIARHPEHRTLFRTLGWIERVGFASYMSYRMSGTHFRQAQLNQQRAIELRLR